MAYVGGAFDHDVFVSYSRGDRRGEGTTSLSRWSRMFAERLQSELQEIEVLADLFFDEGKGVRNSVDPMASLSDQLEARVARTAVLVAVMTEPYLNSRYCKEEREAWFASDLHKTINVPDRAAVVRARPTRGAWPDQFMDDKGAQLFGFYSYDRTVEHDVARPFGWIEDGADKAFTGKLVEIAGRVKAKLDLVRDANAKLQLARDEAAKLASRTEDRTIYLYGRAVRRVEWDNAWRKLSDRGFSVTPFEPEEISQDPAQMNEKRALRRQQLVGCDAMMLLAVSAGELAADLPVVGKEDRHTAREQSGKLLPCAVLDTAGIAIGARDMIAQRFGVSGWIEASRDGWLQDVDSWLLGASRQVLG